jgi:hypothetical protein
MQAAYVRLLRKIKQKADGESAVTKDIVHEGVQKLLNTFPDAAGIIEASRKLYSTAIKTYKTPNTLIRVTANEGAQLLFDKFGKMACPEISYIFSSAIVQYFGLQDESQAKALGEDASKFFIRCDCPDQVTKIQEVLRDPQSKSDFKLF